jgi:structure-specific endonuclease subunit SLX1
METQTLRQTAPWSVYLLSTVEQPIRTYVGATIDIHRRLRQHNGEIGGGAKATAEVPGGWYRICYVRGFESEGKALRFEWYWKNRSKRMSGDPLERRRKALDWLLANEEWREKSLEVIYE